MSTLTELNDARPAEVRPEPRRTTATQSTATEPAAERWPDRIASALFLAATFVAVVAVVPAWRDFFLAPDDPLSLLTIPVVPSLVYAAVLFVVGVAVRRRLRAAWWLVTVWWLVVPELGRVATIVAGRARRPGVDRPGRRLRPHSSSWCGRGPRSSRGTWPATSALPQPCSCWAAGWCSSAVPH